MAAQRWLEPRHRPIPRQHPSRPFFEQESGFLVQAKRLLCLGHGQVAFRVKPVDKRRAARIINGERATY